MPTNLSSNETIEYRKTFPTFRIYPYHLFSGYSNYTAEHKGVKFRILWIGPFVFRWLPTERKHG